MAINNLTQLLREMSPALNDERLVMITTSEDRVPELISRAYAMVREHEGVSFVLNEALARQQGFEVATIFKLISLNVESDLMAVGLTAAIASALSAERIAANVLAGYFHDHILVPEEMADHAMTVLITLSRSS